jgi:hypothetical protein
MFVFIRELDAEPQVLEFAHSKDFEQKFLLPIVRPKEAHKVDPKVLQGFKPEIIQFLSKAIFSNEAPFPGEEIVLDIRKDDLSVIKCSATEGKVLGELLPDVFKSGPAMERFTAAEFKETFANFKKRVASGETDFSQIIGFEAPNREIWLVEIEVTTKKGFTSLTLFNCRNEVCKLLGREDQIQKAEIKGPQNIDVFLIRYNDILEKDPAAWITKIATLTKKLNLWPELTRPKFIIIRYEDDKNAKVDFYHPFVDDMLCLPFDRLIFLQKLEIVMALPEKADPSWLFVQERQDFIEVGKKISIERMSDVGFAVANPVPLAQGTPGHFYFKFPGQKLLLDCHGKVTRSLPHPDRENEHLVFFSFFGLDRNVLKEVRAYLSRDTGYKMYENNNPAEFEFNPDNIFLREDQKRYKTVAVIDTDDKNLENVMTILKKDIGGLHLISDNSYYNFFRNYLSGGPAPEKAPVALREDFYADVVSFLVGVADNNLQMSLTPAIEEQKILGWEALTIFNQPQGWMDIFKSNHARNLMTECFHLVESVKRLTRTFELSTADGSLKSVTVEIILEDNGKIARINMSAPDPRLALSKRIEPLEYLDAIVIDIACIPGEIDTFLNSVKEACAKSGIKSFADVPKLIIIAPEKNKTGQLEKAVKSAAIGYLNKPIEVKRLCYIVHCALENPFTMFNFENTGWKSDVIQGKIARPAELMELAEFGATIKIGQKLKTGSMIYLFKSIYANAPDSNLCCRVYNSVEMEGEDGMFMNYVTYYGITDAFLKFTRAFIRETYAGKKAKESGGSEEES